MSKILSKFFFLSVVFSLFLSSTTIYAQAYEEKYWQVVKCGNGFTYFWDNEFNVYGPLPDVEIVNINRLGRVSGNYMENRAFLFDPDLGFLDLGHLLILKDQGRKIPFEDSELMTRVVDMNENGEIIGFTSTTRGGVLRPFLWSDDYMQDISSSTRIGYSFPVKILNSGEILFVQYTYKGRPIIHYGIPGVDELKFDSAIATLWKDGAATYLFEDYPKLGTKFFGVMPLAITEDRKVLFARKTPTNRFHLYSFDLVSQEEKFIKEIADNFFIYKKWA